MKWRWVGRAFAGVAFVGIVAVLVTVFVGTEFPATPHPARTQAVRPEGPADAGPPTPPASPATPTPPPMPTVMQRLIPETLMIPEIGVHATVEQVKNDPNGAMSVPVHWTDVGWWSPGAAPGQDGDAVIDGHLDWYGVPEAVFYNLGQLKVGDEVDVLSQGNVSLRFKVTASTVVPSTADPAGLWATTGPPRMTLITCAGDWVPSVGQYNQRLLVSASFVGTY